jgi:hypothetical protein
MSETKSLRKHLFVDPKVQGALVLRVVFYWVVCLITMALIMLCWRLLTNPEKILFMRLDDMWFDYCQPALIASCLLLPMVLMDAIRFSNRFVGPLLRLRRSMRELARGENVKPIAFRDSDYWQELAEEFNAVRAKVLDSAAPSSIEQQEEKELSIVG